MSNIGEKLGRRIRTLRVESGLSQEQLAEQAGLSSKYLGEVERGIGNISVEKLSRIAVTLAISTKDLLDTEHEKKTEDLIKEIICLLPALNRKELQGVYRLTLILAGR